MRGSGDLRFRIQGSGIRVWGLETGSGVGGRGVVVWGVALAVRRSCEEHKVACEGDLIVSE